MTSAIAGDPAVLRVLFLTHAFPRWSGDAAGSFLLRLARALQDQQIAVTVLAPHAAGLAANEALEGVPVIRFRYAPMPLETLAYTGTMVEQVRDRWSARAALASMLGTGFWRAFREQRRLDARLVHAHWWFPAGVLAAAISRITALPVVTTMHGSDVRLARSTSGARTALGWVMRGSRATTTVSRWLADEVHELAPALPAPLLSPMPAATDLFFPGDVRDQSRLLFVGRLNAQKGIQLLLRAVTEMRGQRTLDVVGDGPDSEALRALAASLGITDRVVWHGTLPQDRLPPLYRRAAALVVPSRDEGLGLVAVEAQLCETPVVAFASGGLRDVVDDGTTGVLVKEFTAGALARAVDELLESLPRARELGKAGRRAALAVFAPDAVARSYAAIYRNAVATPVHRP
jgi:glycosyltransferase involved in cell wall biosynthesis